MHHHSIFRYLRRPTHHHHHLRRHYHGASAAASSIISSSVISSINWVRDRALDHAVEKERDLKPMINLKNLINLEPSKSLPLSIISNNRSSLSLPTRPIDFIRKYPSVFQTFLPGGLKTIDPHIKLTPETLTLDTEEKLLFQSDIFTKDVAVRLLKMLMLSRVNKIPLAVIDRLKWDLGLPDDYTNSVVPLFPDYFQVTGNGELELVCWSDELAVSVMETKTSSMSSVTFPLQYSRGFEMDNKFKKWVDDWQKLPYVSPYENVSNLEMKSEESDKWVVGLLHEVLHLLVPKKTEKENLLVLGECLGVRSRFKRALLQHPGIFYVSSKLHTHTVVLREGYKRDLLVAKPQHGLMRLRGNYLHLMNMVVTEKGKLKNGDNGDVVDGAKKEKISRDEDEKEEDDEDDEDDDDDEIEGEIDDGDSDDEAIARTKGEDDDGESEVFENRNIKTRGRRNGTEVKFSDSHRRNTPNERVSDGDRRRRGGRGKNREYALDEKSGDSRTNRRMPDRRRYASDEKSDSRTNRMSDGRNASDEKSDSRTNRRMSDRRSASDEKPDDSRINRRMPDRRKYASDEKSDSRTNRMSDGRRYASGEKSDSRTNRRMPDTRSYASDEKSDSRTNRMSDRKVTKETKHGRFSERPGGVSRTRERRF